MRRTNNRKIETLTIAASSLSALACVRCAVASVPAYDHVVVVVEENHSYQQITSIYASSAPYINSTLIAQGASFTNAFAEEHHSEGNYLWLFSGSNHAIGYNDPCPVGPFSTANLGASLIGAGQTFKGYSEDLPAIGSTVCSYNAYARKHNPWVNFTNVPNGTTVATSSNLRFSDFPAAGNYDQLPTVAFVVPNQDNDMHNGGDPASIATGDAWLHNHIDGYYQWAKTHNSLLIVTFDEDQGSAEGLTNPATGANHVVTVVAGAGIAAGAYSQKLTHVNLMRTLEDMYALPHAGSQQSYALAAGFGNAAMQSDFYVQWIGAGDGAWADASNWNRGVVPNGAGAVANFLARGSSPHVVTIANPVTVGVLNFDTPAETSYALEGMPLTLDAPADASTKLCVKTGTHRVNAPLTPVRDLQVRIDGGASLEASALQDSFVTITKSGAGTFSANRIRALSLTVSDGTVGIIANGTPAAASTLLELQVTGRGALDLADNDLMLTRASAATMQADINRARNGGAWDQPGIASSAARAHPAHATTLGVLSGGEYKSVNGASFDDQTVSDTDVLIKYTWYGDTDFNGVVNFDDYVRTDNGFNNNLSGWVNGDFDANGAVNFDDYVLIDLAFNVQDGTLARALSFVDGSDRDRGDMNRPALQRVMQDFDQFGDAYARGFLAAVPEPASLALVPFILLLNRRRRRPR
jgi:acid phosphatase